MASRVTGAIDKFVAEEIEFDALVEFLASFDYAAPSRSENTEKDPWKREAQVGTEDYLEEPNTWDEITTAQNQGKLTFEEVKVINEARADFLGPKTKAAYKKKVR